MITGRTQIIAHIGYPTHAFKAPMIYNPYFEQAGIDVVVVPMGCQPAHFPSLLRSLFQLENLRGALITMPHKVSTVALLDEVSSVVQVAGACNAVRRSAQGHLQGDLFDGEGFVRGVRRKGVRLAGISALIVGAGGVGSAIAASLASAGAARLGLFDLRPEAARGLAQRLRQTFPATEILDGSNDPRGYDLVINATPLGMHPDDPMPVDVDAIAASTFVGEVVMREKITPFLAAAQARGCRVQVGVDMLFEQIPAYLEFFGLPAVSPDELRAVSRLVD